MTRGLFNCPTCKVKTGAIMAVDASKDRQDARSVEALYSFSEMLFDERRRTEAQLLRRVFEAPERE